MYVCVHAPMCGVCVCGVYMVYGMYTCVLMCGVNMCVICMCGVWYMCSIWYVHMYTHVVYVCNICVVYGMCTHVLICDVCVSGVYVCVLCSWGMCVVWSVGDGWCT